jgi:hypothetical protein
MLCHARGLILVSAAMLGWPHPAAAQPIAETVRTWGLLGTWATNCRKPASASNVHLSYVIGPGGVVTHERDFGDRRDRNEVLQATVARDGSIELLLQFKDLAQVRSWVIAKARDGRIRTVSNHLVNTQDYSIRNGKLTAGGKAVPWQSKCGATARGGTRRAR